MREPIEPLGHQTLFTYTSSLPCRDKKGSHDASVLAEPDVFMFETAEEFAAYLAEVDVSSQKPLEPTEPLMLRADSSYGPVQRSPRFHRQVVTRQDKTIQSTSVCEQVREKNKASAARSRQKHQNKKRNLTATHFNLKESLKKQYRSLGVPARADLVDARYFVTRLTKEQLLTSPKLKEQIQRGALNWLFKGEDEWLKGCIVKELDSSWKLPPFFLNRCLRPYGEASRAQVLHRFSSRINRYNEKNEIVQLEKQIADLTAEINAAKNPDQLTIFGNVLRFFPDKPTPETASVNDPVNSVRP